VTWTLGGSDWSNYGPVTLPLEKELPVPTNGRSGGPRGGLDTSEKKMKVYSFWGE